MNLGEIITTLRKKHNLSQADLAKRIEASKESIGKYERNEVSPSVDTAKKIANAFNVTLDYLVNNSSTASFDKKTVQRIQDIENLTEEERKNILAVLDAYLTFSKTKQAFK